MIGLIAVTVAGRASAARLAEAWPGETRAYDGPTRQALHRAWAECDGLVCFLAVGATTRLVAPLLDSKWVDPAVVCVDEAGRYAVALVGGHAAGANALCARVAEVLGAQAVITTATDAAGLPGLDTLGWPAEGAVARVSRALLDGEPVGFEADATWPLPALPVAIGGAGLRRIVVTDRIVPIDENTAVLRPPSLVAGVGASKGVTADEVLALLDEALAVGGLSRDSVTALATVDAKADGGRDRGGRAAGRLAAAQLPGRPARGRRGAQPGRGGAGRRRHPERGRGGGPALRQRTRGDQAQVGDGHRGAGPDPPARPAGPGRARPRRPRPGHSARHRRTTARLGGGRPGPLPGPDPGRAPARHPGAPQWPRRRGAAGSSAVAEARKGHAVALVGSGDAGVYAMASPALAIAGADIDVVGVPGVTAGLAAAALLGAPLGHDHVIMSLSDLHTPWEVIERRIRAAAEGDFVVAFYNPRSQDRDWQLGAALEILARHRDPDTPVGVVHDAFRPGQRVLVTTLADVDPAVADMRSVVIVGSASTQIIAGRMVTPRGYKWQRP